MNNDTYFLTLSRYEMIVIKQALRQVEKTGMEAASPLDIKIIADKWEATIEKELEF